MLVTSKAPISFEIEILFTNCRYIKGLQSTHKTLQSCLSKLLWLNMFIEENAHFQFFRVQNQVRY